MKLGVVGSINVDMVYTLDQFLKKGETRFGDNFQVLMGGKGANQAVMASALNDNVVFLGAVGDDAFADSTVDHLKNKGIDTTYISRKKGKNTGLAIIQLVHGDNSIAVIPGANTQIQKEEIDRFLNGNPDLELVASQLEINMDAISYLIDQCNERKIPIILNPAPAQPLSDEIIEKVNYLIPNETETEYLFHSGNFEELVTRYAGKLIITMGSQGVMYFDGSIPQIAPAEKLTVVDTTGAGDSFVAGFITGIANHYDLKASVELGIKVASIKCKWLGAQGAFEQVRSELYEKIRNHQ
jgi:ribokinase